MSRIRHVFLGDPSPAVSIVHRSQFRKRNRMTMTDPQRPLADWFDLSRDDLVRFCHRYLGQSADAEDVVQEVAAKLAVQSDLEHPRPWMFRVARNLCLNSLRRRDGGFLKDVTLHTDAPPISPETGPRTKFLKSERYAALRNALASMQSNLAEVLTLRYFEGFGPKEIATVLERPEREVKAQLEQARREIARKLRGLGESRP